MIGSSFAPVWPASRSSTLCDAYCWKFSSVFIGDVKPSRSYRSCCCRRIGVIGQLLLPLLFPDGGRCWFLRYPPLGFLFIPGASPPLGLLDLFSASSAILCVLISVVVGGGWLFACAGCSSRYAASGSILLTRLLGCCCIGCDVVKRFDVVNVVSVFAAVAFAWWVQFLLTLATLPDASLLFVAERASAGTA